MKLYLSFQKDLSNRMLCWCQRAACSITFTTRHVAGHSFDGIKLARRHARNVICKCAALQCCCHAEFHCSLALSSFAVQNTLKVRKILGFNSTDASLVHMSYYSEALENELIEVLTMCSRKQKKKNVLSLNLFPFSST